MAARDLLAARLVLAVPEGLGAQRLLALAVYGLARGVTHDLGFTPYELWPIRVDEWLAQLWGGDVVPTVSLQHHSAATRATDSARSGGGHDAASAATYASHFVLGFSIAGVLGIGDVWRRRSAVAARVEATTPCPARPSRLDPITRSAGRRSARARALRIPSPGSSVTASVTPRLRR